MLVGCMSEPTLYKKLFNLLDYIKNRNIRIDLFTNGSTHDKTWWRELNQHLNSNSMVHFTICGSTQELHEKYRVGSNLQQVLENAMAFKTGNQNKNDSCQYIVFNYNENDLTHARCIFKLFTNTEIINSLPYYERFNSILQNSCDITMPYGLSNKYYNIMKLAEIKPANFIIKCRSLETHFILLDNFGKFYPCFLYRIFSKDSFDFKNFRKILAYKYKFCYECEQHSLNLLSLYNIDRMA
jgi:hypothetical protein